MTAESMLSKRLVATNTVFFIFPSYAYVLRQKMSTLSQWGTQDFSMGGSVTSHRDHVEYVITM